MQQKQNWNPTKTNENGNGKTIRMFSLRDKNSEKNKLKIWE